MDILDLPVCSAPPPLPEPHTKEQLQRHIHAMRVYRLCQIQAAQNHLQFLKRELEKDSPCAGIQVDYMLQCFRAVEMAFLTDTRKKLAATLNMEEDD